VAELTALFDLHAARGRGGRLGIPSVCSAHPAVLQAALEQARADGGTVLVESTCNQVNQEGGYTGVRPAGFAAFVGRLAEAAGLGAERVILGGDHLGPHPWREAGAARAMARAEEMVRDYVRAGYGKIHLDASMACADDPPGPLPEAVAAARTAALAAAAEEAAADGPPGRPSPLYVVGTEVPLPGGRADGHAGPVPTRAADAERTLALTHEAFARRGLEPAFARVLALVVQPGVEFGDDVVHRYRGEEAAQLAAVADRRRLVYEAHSTDYQHEEALRALVADGFAILKVGPELTFAFREAVFALESIERELLGGGSRTVRLSGVGQALDDAMRSDPRHWAGWYGTDDEEAVRLRRRFSLSDRCRYYWTHGEVRASLDRLHANLAHRHLPRGLVSQYLPDVAAAAVGDEPDLPARLAELHVRKVLDRYARACHPAPAGISGPTELPLR
jgi:D-tagatose-bisphosphate aldolase class II non-catalytic subunit